MKTSRARLTALLVLLVAPTPLLAGWDEGVAAYNAGRYQEAAVEFRAVVEHSPDAAAAYYMLGMTLLRQQQTPACLEPLAKAVALAPGETRYRLALGQAQLQGDLPEDALATLAALEPASVHESARAVYSQLLAGAATRSRQLDTARAALQEALAAEEGSKLLGMALAQVLRKAGQTHQALAALVAVSEFETAFIAAMAMAQDDGVESATWYGEAFAIARRWAAAEAASIRPYLMAGEAQIGLGDYATARRWFADAAAVDKTDPEPHFKQADCALAEGLAEETLAHVRAGLALDSGENLAHKLFAKQGAAYRRLEEFEKAAESYRQAGDAEKASDMIRFARAKASNAEELAKCKRRVAEIEQLKSEHQDLKGTDAWAQLENDHTAVLEACAEHLQGT